MAFDLIRVLIVGPSEPSWRERIQLRAPLKFEAAGFDIHAIADDTNVSRVLAELRPQIILSLGKAERFPALMAVSLEMRKRWVALEEPDPDPAEVADVIMAIYLVNVTTQRFPEHPLVSVFTPTYLSGDKITRAHRSLLAQTYHNWEWVIYDDSPDAGQTFEQMAILSQGDPRIAAFRGDSPIGNIGEVKRRACGLTRGTLLLELDHDDELMPNALGDLVAASQAFPDAGFFYSDCAEVFESGQNAHYSDGWAFGFGSYRLEQYRGHEYQVTNYPDINPRTLRHIVSVPNHYRAWTRAAYLAAGGHNPQVHVCDDYELLLRTFLVTRFVHIRRFGYIQYHNNTSSGNTQKARNTEIQRLVRYFRDAYNGKVHERLEELGVDDFLIDEAGRLDWSKPNPETMPRANYVYP